MRMTFIDKAKRWFRYRTSRRQRPISAGGREARSLQLETLESRQMLTVTVAALPSAPVYDQPVTLTATLPSDSSGTVTFQNTRGGSTTTLGTASVQEATEAVHFDGSSTVNLGDLGALPTSGSISFWTKADVVEDYDNVLSTSGDAAGNEGIRFEEHGDGSFIVYIGNADSTDSGGFGQHQFTGSFTANTWHHIVLTWDTSAHSVTGYFDDEWAFTDSEYDFPAEMNDVQVGAGWRDRFWTGSVDELLVFNTALSESDVNALWNGGAGYYETTSGGVESSNLMDGYHFDEGTGTTTADFVGSNNGTFSSSGVTWTTGLVASTAPQAFLAVSDLAIGDNYVTAEYDSDTSDSVDVVVSQATVAPEIATSNTTLAAGQSATFTATMPSDATGSVEFDVYAPDGVTLLDSGTESLSGGTASFTTSALVNGSDTIDATYSGDANYTSSSNSISETVSPLVNLSSADNPIVAGQNVTLEAHLPGDAVGSVSFVDNSTDTTLGSASLSSVTGGVHFNGSSTVNIGNLGATPTSGTISFWTEADTVADYNNVLSTSGDQAGNEGIRFEEHADGEFLVYIGNADSSTTGGFGQHHFVYGGFTADEWYHVVLTWNTSTDTVTGYLNGSQVFNESEYDFPTALNDVQVGSGWYQRFWTGSVAQLLFYNTALSSDDVTNLYNDGDGADAPYTADLIAGYDFDEGSGTIASDFSGNGHNGTLSTGTTWISDGPVTSNLATITVSGLSAGAHDITAVFTPDDDTPYSEYSSYASNTLTEEVAEPAIFDQSSPGTLTDGSLTLPFAPLSLNYISQAAIGQTFVSADATLQTTNGDESAVTSITATATLGGLSSSALTYSADTSDTATYQITLPINASSLASGRYAFTITVTETYADSSTQTLYYTGYKDVLNRSLSTFGAGWNLDGLDSLAQSTAGVPDGVSLITGNGTMGYFWANTDGSYSSEAGPFAFYTLTGSWSTGFTLTGTNGKMESFNTDGQLISVTDHDGNVTQFNYAYVGGALTTIVDPTGRTTTYSFDETTGLLDSVTDFASRTTYLYYSSGTNNLSEVDLPDPETAGETAPVYYFTNDGPQGQLSAFEDANANVTNYSYDSNSGALSTVTNPDSTTELYASADYEAVQADITGTLVSSTALTATYTDESSNVTAYALNSFGEPLSVTDSPDGGTTLYITTYSYDADGRILTEVQPGVTSGDETVDPTTTYNYTLDDVNTPDLQSESLPDGANETWIYYAYTTPGGEYDVPTAYVDGLGHETAYSYDTSTIEDGAYVNADLLSVEQEASAGTVDPTNDIITSYTYTALPTGESVVPAGQVYTMTDPNGNVTDYVYDSSTGLLNTVVSAAGTGIATTVYYSYDSDQNLESYTDANGQDTTFTYDTLGRELSETDPADSDGNHPVTSYLYDPMGNVVQTTDPLGNITTDTYDWRGNVLTVTSPAPNIAPGSNSSTVTTTNSYTPTGLLYQVTDADGGITTYAYDGLERETSVTAPNASDGSDSGGPVTSFSHDAIGRKTSMTDPNGNTTDYAYTFGTSGSPGMTVTTTFSDPSTGVEGEGPATTDVYDADGNLLSTTDGLNNTVTYSYDAFNRAEQQSSTVGDTTVELGPLYDKDGNVISDTDLQNGAITYYSYNALNELVQTTHPSTDGTADDTHATQYGYDADGNRTSETTFSNYAFNQYGVPLEGVTPQAMVATYTFDNLDRELSVSLPDPTTGEATGPGTSYTTDEPTTTYSYDLDDNLLTTTDPLGHTTTNSYDAQNNLLTTTDADSGVTTYSYGNLGQTLSLSDSVGNTTSWSYDYDGNELSETQPVAGGGTVTSYYSYDLDGNRTQSTDADGRVIDYAFDHLNRETNEYWYASATAEEADPDHTDTLNTVSYSYDANNNMLAASNNAASYTYQYDPVGNVAGENIALSSLPTDKNVIFTSTYDFNDDRRSLAANIGGTLNTDGSVSDGTADFLNTYTYNSLGQMASVAQTDQSATSDDYNGVTAKNVTFSYDSAARLSGMNLYQSTGTSTPVAAATYAYDNDSNLTDLTYTNGQTGGSLAYLAAYHWDYDTAGRVSDEYSLADTSGSHGFGGGYTSWAKTTYGYDNVNELTSTSYSGSFADAPTTNTSEIYDSNGNRSTSIVSVGTESSSSSANMLASDGTYNYTYDAVGNRLTRTSIADGTVTAYGWNNANELVSVKTYASWSDYTSHASPTSDVDYTYDPFGNMVSRNDGTTNENYIYDGQNLALVLNSDGQVTERELYGPAVDQVLASEAVAPVSSGTQAAGIVSWMLADKQGTIRDVAQLSGSTTNIVDHLVYDAFGKISYQSSPSNQPRFTFTGRQFDSATGLYYNRARWYDPANGVWISQDPLGFAAGQTNLEEYGGNSPTNCTDPSGMAVVMPGDPGWPTGIIGIIGRQPLFPIFDPPEITSQIGIMFTPPPPSGGGIAPVYLKPTPIWDLPADPLGPIVIPGLASPGWTPPKNPLSISGEWGEIHGVPGGHLGKHPQGNLNINGTIELHPKKNRKDEPK